MYISKREKTGRIRGAHAALLVVLASLFSATVFAQVPVQIDAQSQGLQASDLSMASNFSLYSDYESTDFTFDLADLPLMQANASELGVLNTKHSIKCQKNTDIDFGRAFSGITEGTVILDPNGNAPRKQTGGVILDNRNQGHPAFLQLTIYNEEHQHNDDHANTDDDECNRSEDDDNTSNDTHSTYLRHGVWNTITLPSSSILSLTLGGQTYTMTADNYTFIRNNGNFNIGATLHVGANQVAGVYRGTFTVTQTCD